MSYTPPILLYDSECTMCKRFKNAVQGLGNAEKITFVAVSDSQIYKDFPDLDPKECQLQVHLIDEQLNIWQGSEVIEYLLKFLPAVKKFAWLIEFDAGKKALNLFYKMVNKLHKSDINRCSKC